MPVIFNNNAITTLNGAITNVATSITVTAGGVFPVTASPDYCYLTITEGAKIEIIKATDITGNVITAVRGQDGTTAQAFSTLSRVDLRLTTATLVDALADNILSDAAIKTAYENNTNTNAYDDAAVTKLGNIEAAADVTDVTNVTAAGALMDSEVDANIKTLALPASTTISAFVKTLLDDTSAAIARGTLGVDVAGTINYTHPNHTGDVTSTGDGATVIPNNTVTLAKMADIATASILGRNTAATGDPEVLTPAVARGILNVADGAEVNPAPVSLAAAQAGTDTAESSWTAQRVRQAVQAAPTYIQVQVTLNEDFLVANTGLALIHVPFARKLTAVHAEVGTAGVTGLTTIDINRNGTSMLTTKLTIDSGETGSDTAVTAAVIDAAQDDTAINDVLTIDIDLISTGTAPKGLTVTLTFENS